MIEPHRHYLDQTLMNTDQIMVIKLIRKNEELATGKKLNISAFHLLSTS